MIWVAAGALVLLVVIILSLMRRSGVFGMLSDHKHVALVVAHPDDEAMFFWPALSELHSAGATLSVLCLSTGNFDGLGEIRRREMENSCQQIGVSGDALLILDDPELQDGWQKWPSNQVADKALKFLAKRNASGVLTFDGLGVSGHPNHISASEGMQEAWRLAREGAGLAQFELFMLRSVPMYRKYLGPIGMLFDDARDAGAVSGNPIKCLKALSAHWSQLVWYRIFFTLLSCYGYANSFVRYDADVSSFCSEMKKEQ